MDSSICITERAFTDWMLQATIGSTLRATMPEHDTTTQVSALDFHPTWSLLLTKTSVLQPEPPRQRRHLGYYNGKMVLSARSCDLFTIPTIPWTLTSSRKTTRTILNNILTTEPRDNNFGPWGSPSGNGLGTPQNWRHIVYKPPRGLESLAFHTQ